MQPVDPRIAAQRPTGCCSARLLGCGTRSPLYVIGDAASRRGLSRVGYFITLNGPLNGNPPSLVYIDSVSVIYQHVDVYTWVRKYLKLTNILMPRYFLRVTELILRTD